MKLTNDEKNIIRVLIYNELNFYENEDDLDADDYIEQLKAILNKLERVNK